MIRLVPMTDADFHAFHERSVVNYASAHVSAGTWLAEEALERSRAEHDQLLPQGVKTPGHWLFTVVDESAGTRVGELWYQLQHPGSIPQLFIYWIGIDERFRGHGFGTEVLHKVEEAAREHGARRVALHVFADNTKARDLYARLGYSVGGLSMAKPVAPAAGKSSTPIPS